MLWWDNKGDSTWYWGLYPQDESYTRLITRVRLAYRWTKPSIIFSLLVEFTDIVMMRKCMLSIKQRAERDSVYVGATQHNQPQLSESEVHSEIKATS
jgi:hypothetical protein